MRQKQFILGCLALFSFNFAQGQSDHAASEFDKTSLGEINTSYMEVRPLISSDGTTLFFARRNYEGNVKGVEDQDIYVAYKEQNSGRWQETQQLTRHLNNKKWNAVASLSPDGEELILFNTYKKTRNSPLARSMRENKGWSKPKAIRIENYFNASPYADFHLDYRHNVLIMAIESLGTVGEQDLYVSFPEGEDAWSEPVHMGAVINSEKADFAPFMGADGRSLFFSSQGHESLGGSDIFMSVRLDDTWTNWSEPVNLGPSINTSENENYFSIDDNFEFLYLSSYKEGAKASDIQKIRLPEDFTAINGPVLANLDSAAIAEIMLSGNYKVNPDGRKTNVQGASFKGWPEEEEVIASADEPEETSVEEEENEFMPARLRGFRSADEVTGLDAESEAMRDYLQRELPNVDLAIRQSGDTTEFKLVQNLLYGFNSVYISRDYVPRFRKISRLLKNQPALTIELIGHTDNVGSKAVNERVARKRVNNLVHLLSNSGISRSRIEVIGLGKEEPIASNDTEEGRNLNRRVETIIKYTK